MRLLQKFFYGTKEPFQLKYNKVFEEWQVFEDSRVIYQGSKERCMKYIKFMSK